MPIIHALGNAIAAQRGFLLCWAPVCLAVGIGMYYSFSVDQGIAVYSLLILACIILFCFVRWISEGWRPLFGAAP